MLSTAKSRPLSGNDFIAYLKHKQFSQRSLETSQRIINNYLQWVTKENLEPEAVTYQDLLEFMKHGRKTGKSGIPTIFRTKKNSLKPHVLVC